MRLALQLRQEASRQQIATARHMQHTRWEEEEEEEDDDDDEELEEEEEEAEEAEEGARRPT